MGDEDIRREWTLKLSGMGYIMPTLIHPTAFIPDDVQIGSASVICARATIGTLVKLGRGVIVTSGSIVPRKTRIPDWQQFEFDRIIREKNGIKMPASEYQEGKR